MQINQGLNPSRKYSHGGDGDLIPNGRLQSTPLGKREMGFVHLPRRRLSRQPLISSDIDIFPPRPSQIPGRSQAHARPLSAALPKVTSGRRLKRIHF